MLRFTLNRLFFILFVFVLSCPFGAQKDEKARHRAFEPLSPLARELPPAISLVRRPLAVSSLSAVRRALRNSLRAAMQGKLYPHFAHTVLAQWPAYGRALHSLTYSAGLFRKLLLLSLIHCKSNVLLKTLMCNNETIN